MEDEFDDQHGVVKFVPLNGVPTKIVIYDENKHQNQSNIDRPFEYDQLILMISGMFRIDFGFKNIRKTHFPLRKSW